MDPLDHSTARRRRALTGSWSGGLLIGLLAQACAGGAAEPPPPGEPPPLPAQVSTAQMEAFPLEISTVGSLRSPETTVVSADVAGIIVELNAPEGKSVPTRHLIARLDDSEARAAVQVAEAREKNARAALERIEPLYRDGVTSRQDYDNAVAELTTAQGLLAEAETELQKTRVRAPFSGTIGIQTAQLGQHVAAGEAIVSLTQVNPLELIFGVPEAEAGNVRLGQQVRARVGRCGVTFRGIVEALDPALDPETRTLPVQARVDNRELQLRPGMSARVRLVVGEKQALVVPREALAPLGTQYQVWVVGEEERVKPRPVTVGRFLPDRAEIRSGLESGARVVASGHQKLRPGMAIAATPWQPTVNPYLELGQREDDCADL